MNAPVHTPTPGGRRAPRIALAAIICLALASLLLQLNDIQIGPAWVHGVGSLVAVVAALGAVVATELTWHRAVTAAESAGLVATSTLAAEPNPAGGQGR